MPADNPFVGTAGARPEIWSFGLRNPWRFSFDRATDDLWIADVGQDQWEEVDVAWADEGGGRGTAAIALVGLGARVGITGHDRARAVDAAAAITRETGNPAVDIFVADMSSQAEVRRLAIGELATIHGWMYCSTTSAGSGPTAT